jgi:molybdenum ABC transporter molybdate-binding protein
VTAARALLLFGLLGALGTEPANAMEKIIVLAAGSLRAPLTELGRDYERTHGVQVAFTFGASGLLRDRILAGEPADVFASANMAHPRALIDSGWASEVQHFARNVLCVVARQGVAIATDTVLSVLLDPAVSVGTSTPGADPGGDYAWEVFQRADAVRPGAVATM